MSVVIRDPFGDPKSARVRRPRKVPRPQLDRPQALHVPHVKEFVRRSFQGLLVSRRVRQLTRLNNLCGSDVFHSIARVAIVREMDQESVRIKLRRSPHRRLSAHNLFQVAHQRRPFAGFFSE